MAHPPKPTKVTERRYKYCNPHPFDTEDADFKYIKNTVLPTETGSKDLISPCHEYKSFQNVSRKDVAQQKLKFGTDVMKFAAACMNTRTNGTIHFGVEDGGEDYVHGEIVGVPVRDRALYTQTREEYIRKCFWSRYGFHAERAIRPPRLVEVTSSDPGDQCFVIEVDIVPLLAVVKGTFYSVRLPNFKGKMKPPYCSWCIYKRVGAASVSSTKELRSMPDYIRARDFEREEAERKEELATDDVYRKLAELFGSVKRHLHGEVKYILVINSCKEEDLENLSFLLSMRFFCVLDFDPNSKLNGLNSLYPKAKCLYLEDCTTDSGVLAADLKQGFFQKTVWIFCNGQNVQGDLQPYGDDLWLQTRKEILSKTISQIWQTILPPGSFEVLFLLVSAVDRPLAEAFHEFSMGMNGRSNIKCIAADRQNYSDWTNLVHQSCNRETINNLSIVGTKLQHLDAMIQIIQSSGIIRPSLPDDRNFDELLPFIEVLRANEYNGCDIDPSDELCQELIKDTQRSFYRGGKVHWMNFWLADHDYCGAVIQRDAYKVVEMELESAWSQGNRKGPVLTVTIAHQPGSGGSTVARHIVWDFSKKLRCGIINTLQPEKSICSHVVQFLECPEEGEGSPVLLLAEDCDEDYVVNLKDQLTGAVGQQGNGAKLKVILLHCTRVSIQDMYRAPRRVNVHFNLSPRETQLFKNKLAELKQEFEENAILTFALMTQEFDKASVKKSVEQILADIGVSSDVARLLGCIALLNHYVQDSYITVSQFESFLNASFHPDHPPLPQDLRSASNQPMNFLLSHLSEATTELQCVRIIHHKVAEEILNQLSPGQLQSHAAAQLLEKATFFQHKSTTQVSKFIRQLFVQRTPKHSKQRLDFPPMIAHIKKSEHNCRAAEVLEKACDCFDEDVIVIQQLVRFLYRTGEFEIAKSWIEKAKSLAPSNSYILDTEGQVYKKWLFSLGSDPGKLDQAVELALKGIDAFQRSQEASESEAVYNIHGYFGEVEVGCYIVQLMPLLGIFSEYKNEFYPKLVKYLVTEWIPEEIEVRWAPFHDKLKSLHNNICKSMEWIYEYMAYFGSDKRTEAMVQRAFENLKKNEKQFSSFFNCPFNDSSAMLLREEKLEDQALLLKCRRINYLGGGSLATIFALDPGKLREIINTDPPPHGQLHENYMLSRIAFDMIKHSSPEEDRVSKEQLRALSHPSNPSVGWDLDKPIPHFITLLLYWPDGECDDTSGQIHDEYLMDALTALNNLYKSKIKGLQGEKKPISPHFFLRRDGSSLKRFVHHRWLGRHNGEYDWQKNQGVLQRARGLAEGKKLYIPGHGKESRLPVHRAFNCPIPAGSTEVSFYLAFTLRGCVAYDIRSETHV